MKKMTELIHFIVSRTADYWDALIAVAAGMIGATIAYASSVRSGESVYSASNYFMQLASAGFFSWATFMVCIHGMEWTPGLSVAAAGMVGHMGADKVKTMMADYFKNRIK
jgi:hypothetical protein